MLVNEIQAFFSIFLCIFQNIFFRAPLCLCCSAWPTARSSSRWPSSFTIEGGAQGEEEKGAGQGAGQEECWRGWSAGTTPWP